MRLIYLLLFIITISSCGTHRKSEDSKKESSTELNGDKIISPITTSDLKQTNLERQSSGIKGITSNNNRGIISVIEFNNGQRINILDIDPYKNLEYPKMRNWEDSLENLYDLSEIDSNEISRILYGKRVNDLALRSDNYLRLYSKPPVVDIKKNTAIVAFELEYYSSDEDILATEGVVFILNEEGKIVRKIEDKRDGFYDVQLSTNGDYILQKFGSNYGEDGGGQLVTGFKVYEITSGDKILDLDLGREKLIGSYGCNRNQNSFYVVVDSEKSWDWFHIEPSINKYFTKSWDRSLFSINKFDRESGALNWFEIVRDSEKLKYHKITAHKFNQK